MKLERLHSFSQEEATARIRALTDYWDTKYGIRADWEGKTVKIKGKVRGVKFDATMTVESDRLVGEVKTNFLAEKLGGRAYVERKLADYLDPINTLEQLRSRI